MKILEEKVFDLNAQMKIITLKAHSKRKKNLKWK